MGWPWARWPKTTGALGVVGVLAIGHAFRAYSPWELRRVEGPSMRPTFNPIERSVLPDIVLCRQIPRSDPARPGQVVICRDPNPHRGPPGFLIKRIVAGPGDSVRLPNGRLFRVPEDHFWLGSDAGVGLYRDSSVFGPVRRDLIVSRPVLIVFPWTRWSRVA